MFRRSRTVNLPSLAAALLLLFSQAARGQTVQTRRLPGDEPPARPRPGAPHVRLRAELSGEVFALAFSPDGRLLAVSTINHVVKLWGAETGELVSSLETGRPVSKLLWSPDGRVLATEDAAQTFQFWDAETGGLKARTGAHRKPVTQAGWAAGHAALLTLDEDRWLRAWETSGGRLLYERRLKGLKGLTFGPGGGDVLAFREYERPELLDPLTGERKAEVGTGRVRPFFGAWLAFFSPEGRRLLFRDGFKGLRLHDLGTGADSALRLAQSDHDYLALAFSRDGRLLALVRQPFTWSLGADSEVRLYDVEASALLPVALRAKGFGRVFKVALSEDGATLAAAGSADPKLFASGGLTAYTWRVADGATYAAFPLERNERGGFMTNPPEDAETVELLAGGRVLLTYNRESVKFWDARTGERLYRREAGRVAVSPGRRLVALASEGGSRAQVWEAVAP